MNKPLLAVAAVVAVGAIGLWFVTNQTELPSPGDASVPQQDTDNASHPSEVPVIAPAPLPDPQAESTGSRTSTRPGAPASSTEPPLAAPSPSAGPATASSGPMPAVSALSVEQKGGADASEVERDVESVKLMLRDYRTLMGGNPVGTNAEIMKAITGGNPRQATLGPPEGQRLNEKGELVDRWGTPYFFHQLSQAQMEIHSAGPDKVMWTADDTVSNY